MSNVTSVVIIVSVHNLLECAFLRKYIKKMSKPIKSNVRKMLFTMINKYDQMKSVMDTSLKEKNRLLAEIESITGKQLRCF